MRLLITALLLAAPPAASQEPAKPPGFRGALVYKSKTPQPIRSGIEGIAPITFDKVVYDTCGCWDAATSRMVVPKGAEFVELEAQAVWTYPTADKISSRSVRQIVIKKNFVTLDGWYNDRPGWSAGQVTTHNGTTVDVSANGPVLPVVAGDTFLVDAYTSDGDDAAIMANNGTWFAIKIVD